MPFLETIKSPILIANVDDSQEPSFQGKYTKSMVITKYGREIGIVGVTTTMKSNWGRVNILPEVEAVRDEVAKLTADGIKIIIVLSHCGLDIDRKIAHQGGPIDIIVGGHTHSFLFSGENPPGPDRVVDSYPTIEKNEEGEDVLIVQASAYTKYLGDITLYFDEEGKVKNYEGAPIFLDHDVVQDTDILEELEPWKAVVNPIQNRVVGEIKFPFPTRGCYVKECLMGSLTADAYADQVSQGCLSIYPYDNSILTIWYIKAHQVPCIHITCSWSHAPSGRTFGTWCVTGWYQVTRLRNLLSLLFLQFLTFKPPNDNNTWTGATIALAIPGGIRAGLSQGEIVFGDAFTTTPFENFLHSVELQGKVIRAALEFSVEDENSLVVLQSSGLKVTYDMKRSKNSRIVSLLVLCRDCEIPKYEPIDDEKFYRVVMPSYLANGGDGFKMIPEGARNLIVGPKDIDALTGYIEKSSPISLPPLSGRINFV